MSFDDSVPSQAELAIGALRRYFVQRDVVTLLTEMQQLTPSLERTEPELHVAALKKASASIAKDLSGPTLSELIAVLADCQQADQWDGIPREIDVIFRFNVPEYVDIRRATGALS